MAKKVKNTATKFDPDFVRKLKFFLKSPCAITTKGIISDTKIANLLDVSRETVRRWRKIVPGCEDCYQKSFAMICDQLQQAVDDGQIKRSMVEKARGFVQTKTVKELRTIELPDGSCIEKMVIVKKESTTVAGDCAAAKMVLSNIDKKQGDKWSFKEEMTADVKVDPLTFLLKEIDGTGKQLPDN